MRVFFEKDKEGYITRATRYPDSEDIIDLSDIPRTVKLPSRKGTRTHTLSPEEHMHNVAMRLIAFARTSARDHEHYDRWHDGSQYHGAALVETSEGRFYLRQNFQTSHDHTQRDCAEALAISEIRDDPGVYKEGERFENLWFSGGTANFQADPPIELKEGQEGRLSTPCGSCLELLHHENPNGMVHVLPMFLPEAGKVLLSQGGAEKLGTRVLSKKVTKYYQPRFVELNRPELKDGIAEGYDFISQSDEETPTQLSNSVPLLRELSKKDVGLDEKLKAVHTVMMRQIRAHFAQEHGNITEVDMTIIENYNGNFYVGDQPRGPGISAMAMSLSRAIQSAQSAEHYGPAKNVYFMSCDLGLMQEIAEVDDVADAPAWLTAPPKGQALERLRKYAAISQKRFDETGLAEEFRDKAANPKILIITPVHPDNFKPNNDQHVRKVRLNKLIANPYAGPKEMGLEKPKSPGE